MKGELYLVATPIGNLEDITLRAIRILKEVDIIAAEDTRHTLKLLNALEISKPLMCYHRHNEEVKTEEIIRKVEAGQKIALVSDAGTPVISDPGEEVVKKALEVGITVIPIPGPCALITALIASGIGSKEFTFMGFLSLNKKNRKEKLLEIERETKTSILYEAPHKLRATLQDLETVTKDRNMVVAKELTKIHEQYIKGTAKELLEKIQDPKGEYVIVIEGAEKIIQEDFLLQLSLEKHYQYYMEKGFDKKEIIKQIAKDRSVTKNEIYQYFLEK